MARPDVPKKALVTGASSGIGEALCRLLASQGVSLMITGRQEERLHALTTELQTQVSVLSFTADLALPQGRQCVVEMLREQRPDLVVNNAGFGIYGEAVSRPARAELEMAEVNALAVLELTLEAARMMLEAGMEGVVLNVSSAAAFQVFPMLATYAASKVFVNQLSESLDYELRAKGVRVLAACPGMVDTGFRARASGIADEPAKHWGAMTAAFAAEQLWRQIVSRKQLYIFDWKTRVGTFFSRYILPKKLVAMLLSRNIRKRTIRDGL